MKLKSIVIIMIGVAMAGNSFSQDKAAQTVKDSESKIIELPNPSFDSETSIEKALKERHSVRKYSDEALTLAEISQMLWAAQGINIKKEKPSRKWNEKYEWQGGKRTAPSAGGLYPMELYLIVGNVEGLDTAVYKYIPKNHSIIKVIDENKQAEVQEVAWGTAVGASAAVIVMSSVLERISIKYGERAQRYVFIEVGHIGQNIYLQGISLGIGTVMMGAIKDEPRLKKILNMPEVEEPMAIMPIGKMIKE